MTRDRRLLVALALVLGATCVGPAASAVADPAGLQVAGAAWLEIEPDEYYVAGQKLRWIGNLGVTGAREIVVQRHLGREDDEWATMEDFSGETKADGSFAFSYPATSMRYVDHRVAAAADTSIATPAVELAALQQDIVMWVAGDDPDDPRDIGAVLAGEPFDVTADSAPVVPRRPDRDGLLPIPGRKLTLQRLAAGTGDSWITLGRTKADRDGMGYFTGLTEQSTGEVVYRVRQEDWKKGGDDIGWLGSFPTWITVSAPGSTAGPAMSVPAPVGLSDAELQLVPMEPPGSTASQLWGWPKPQYDFAWVQGESLTSPPYRGQTKKGWWLDYSDGGGRGSKDSGGLVLDSKRDKLTGDGDFGTTMLTLRDHSAKAGRWETKLKVTPEESGDQDYLGRLELVPDRDPDDRCRTITVAELVAGGDEVRFGVNAGRTHWTGTAPLPVGETHVAFAAEVTKDHITWYMDGRPIGTVTSRSAFPKVALTQRLSLVGGDAQQEMNRTVLTSDWQRGFDLDGGTQVKDGDPLEEQPLETC